jgi:host factor-I protein
MDNTAQNSQNVQDGFLNNLRRDRINVTIYLIGGVKLTGKIRSFDKFSVVLESGNLEQLIFKHAISTISVPRGSYSHPRPDQRPDQRPERDSHHHSVPPASSQATASAPGAGGNSAPAASNS